MQIQTTTVAPLQYAFYQWRTVRVSGRWGRRKLMKAAHKGQQCIAAGRNGCCNSFFRWFLLSPTPWLWFRSFPFLWLCDWGLHSRDIRAYLRVCICHFYLFPRLCENSFSNTHLQADKINHTLTLPTLLLLCHLVRRCKGRNWAAKGTISCEKSSTITQTWEILAHWKIWSLPFPPDPPTTVVHLFLPLPNPIGWLWLTGIQQALLNE